MTPKKASVQFADHPHSHDDKHEVKHVSFNKMLQRQSTDHTNIRRIQWNDVMSGTASLSLGLLKQGCTYKMRFKFDPADKDTFEVPAVEMIGNSGVSFAIEEDTIQLERTDTPTDTNNADRDVENDGAAHTTAHDGSSNDTKESPQEHADTGTETDASTATSICPESVGHVFLATISTEYEGKISQVQNFLVKHEGSEYEVAVTLLCTVMRKGSGTPSLKPGVRLVGCASHDSDYETEWTGF